MTATKNVKKSPAARKGPQGAQHNPFDLKPARRLKEPREGSKRAAVLRMLLRKGGATFRQVQSVTDWDHKTAQEGIRLINRACGYGLQENEGRISAYSR